MKKMLPIFAAAFFIFGVNVSAMSLNAHNSDLRSLIMLVAANGNLNVALDDSVKGAISIQLENVAPKKILEIIAKAKNLQLIKENGIYIFTAEIKFVEPMQTYILPIRYGDAEILRTAIYKSLNFDEETPTLKTFQVEGADGVKKTYNYVSSNRKNSSGNSDEDKDPRSKRVFVNSEVNAIILFGTQSEYERAKKILETLDVELKQVSVEAKILAIDKSASKNLGIEWMWSTVPQYPTRNENSVTRNYDDNTGYGILRFGRSHDGYPFEWYYGAKINALVENGKAKVLSRPNVTTIQGKEAIINVGQSIPVPTESTTNSTTTTSFQYRDVGIILKYTPRINFDGTITATIHTEVSTPEYVEEMNVYKFNTRSADTTVTVKDGEAMVIGGLIGAEESKQISKIPILGDLPILGALFRNHRNSKSESELIIFLTAHVLEGEK